MTIRDAHQNALQVLAQSQNLERAEALVRARLLLDFATQKRYAHLMVPEQNLDEAQLQVLANALSRASRGEPLPYIIGTQEFMGGPFEVGPGTLIPRPETESLVEFVERRLRGPQPLRLADLGTGSGAIAISLASRGWDTRVLATDISSDALSFAARNAARHEVDDRIEFVLSDASWTAPLQGRIFDAIVSNPPYIPARDIEGLQIEVRQFEPRAALDGGEDGLDPYRIFARELGKYLRPGGFVALELGAGQWPDVARLFEESGWRVEPAILDFAGIERVFVATV